MGLEVFQRQHHNMDAINAALRKMQYRGKQILAHNLLKEADMAQIFKGNKLLSPDQA